MAKTSKEIAAKRLRESREEERALEDAGKAKRQRKGNRQKAPAVKDGADVKGWEAARRPANALDSTQKITRLPKIGATAENVNSRASATADDPGKDKRLRLLSSEVEKGNMKRKQRAEQRTKERLLRKERVSAGAEKLFQNSASFLSAAQKGELSAKFPKMLASNSSLLDTVIDLRSEISLNPDRNYYFLELLLQGLESRARKLFHRQTQTSDGDPLGNGDKDEGAEENPGEIGRVLLLLFFSIGEILKDILPSYFVILNEETKGKDKGKDTAGSGTPAKDSSAVGGVNVQMMKIYKRWIDKWLCPLAAFVCGRKDGGRGLTAKSMSGKKRQTALAGGKDRGKDGGLDAQCLARAFPDPELLRPKLELFIADFLSTAKMTNYNDAIFEIALDLLASTPAPTALPASLTCLPATESWQELYNEMGSVLRQDVTLGLCARIVKMIVGRGSSPGIQRVITLTDFLDVDRKAQAAMDERARRGLDSADAAGETRDKDLLKDLDASLVSGSRKLFLKNKSSVLTDLVVFFVQTLRKASSTPPATVIATLQTVSKLTHLINAELLSEILIEVRRIALGQWQSCPTSGLLLIACLGSTLTLVKADPKNLTLATDVAWVAGLLSRAFIESLPLINHDLFQSNSTAIESDSESNPGGSTDVYKIVSEAASANRLFGLDTAQKAKLCKSESAAKFFSSVYTAATLAEPATAAHLQAIMNQGLTSYPFLEQLFTEPEGLIFSSLTPPQTLSFVQHLSDHSLVAAAAQRTHTRTRASTPLSYF